MTSAESVALDLFALGAFVQFALMWPFLPQRKQIGAGRFPDADELAGLSGLPHWGRGGEGALEIGLALLFGRGDCWWPFFPVPFPFPLDFPFLPPVRPNRG